MKGTKGDKDLFLWNRVCAGQSQVLRDRAADMSLPLGAPSQVQSATHIQMQSTQL